jgi:hypothetical protein
VDGDAAPAPLPHRVRTPLIEDNVFVGNSALEGGGIRFCFFTGGILEPTIRGNAILDNEATLVGGGVAVYDADPVIENCTFDGNGAGQSGGGVHVADTRGPERLSATLVNSIVTNSTSGGGLAGPSAQLTTARCDVWGNTGGDYVGCGPGADDFSTDPLYCDPPGRDLTLRDDSPCLPENNEWNILIGAYTAGGCGTSVAGEEVAVPSFRLLPPFPSPSSGLVTLRYTLEERAPIELAVVTVSGRVVRRFTGLPGTAGEHSVVWDGTDAQTRPVASGVYLVRASAGTRREYRAVVILRRG